MRIDIGANISAAALLRATGCFGPHPHAQPIIAMASTQRRTAGMYASDQYNPSVAKWWRRELETYDGRLMRCAPGTHEAAMRLIAAHVPKTAKVLDLASGTGAM